MYDVPHLIPRSPQPTRSMASSTPTRQSPMRLSSPSKARATPSRARQMSPRKSPAKSRIFHAISAKSVSFTPEKTKQPPRAWERRPATPFVPRDDKQKIWKRVPLGEIGIEPNRPVNISRKDQEATKDYVRVVKKLKVGHGSDDEDKENVSAGAKMDIEDKDPKRRVRFDSRFVTMKAEEDVILGSPKKKLRTVTGESRSHAEQEMRKTGSEDGEENVDEYEAMDTPHQVTYEDQDGQDHQASLGQNIEVSRDAEPAAEVTDVLPHEEHSNDDDPTLEQVTSDASCCEILAADAHGPGGMSSNAPSGSEIDAEITVPDTLQMGEPSEQVSSPLAHGNPEPADPNDQEVPTQSMELDEPLITSQQLSTEIEDDVVESPVPMPEEPRSSSPPTVLAENVIVDELESRNVSKLDASGGDRISPSDEPTEAHESEITTTQEQTSRRVSDDEAAFLRNFVSTSKAERAARERRIQEMLSDESTNHQEEMPQAQTEAQEVYEEVTHAVDSIPKLEPSTEVPIDNISSSPLRRSKRAVITSIPRPQTLPNAIQLKRANGNEFIFTANKASSMVNVAVVTRSNTKGNKGSALSVPQRLEQLSAGEKAVGDASEASDKFALDNANDKAGAKKRKREAKDGGIRAKKILRWNDENLVSYQEAERLVDGWEDIDDSSQENNITHESETEDSDKHVKLTLTMTSSGTNSTHNSTSTKEPTTSSKSSTKDQKELPTSILNSSQNKFRRVRRGTSGTVNGTPGPKTRSRRVAEDDEKDATMDVPVDTNGSVEDSTAVVAAISNLAATTEVVKGSSGGGSGSGTGKKSRMPMPVPVASGLSARRGVAASASIRGTSTVGRVGAVTPVAGPSEVRKAKESSKSQVQTQTSTDDGKGDLLGKRRLRVRP